MKHRGLAISAIILVLTFGFEGWLHAQEELEHLSPFAHGAGRTYALTSRGLDAVGLNPSLLALGTPRPLEITIAPISSLGINAGPSLSQINSVSAGFDSIASQYIPPGGTLTTGDSIRESIANLLANNELSSTIDARIFGISYYTPDLGGFAFTWTMHAILEASIPSELLNFIGVNALAKLGQGNALSPQYLNIQALWYSEYTASYARTLFGAPSSGDVQLLAGVGLKYLSGIAVMQMNPGEFDINDPAQHPEYSDLQLAEHYIIGVNYQIRSAYPTEFNFTNLPSTISTKLIANATAGNGFGADLGITLGQFDSAHNSPWELALSVSDLGSITWNSNVSIRSADTVINPKTSQSNKDTPNSQLRALGGTLDTAHSFTMPLPTTLHVAAALDLSQIGLSLPGAALGIVSEYALGLTNTVGAPVHGRFGIAATLEHPSRSLSFHAALGYATQDGSSDVTAAFGIGLASRILVDVGTSSLNGLFSKTGHSDAVFGLKVLF